MHAVDNQACSETWWCVNVQRRVTNQLAYKLLLTMPTNQPIGTTQWADLGVILLLYSYANWHWYYVCVEETLFKTAFSYYPLLWFETWEGGRKEWTCPLQPFIIIACNCSSQTACGKPWAAVVLLLFFLEQNCSTQANNYNCVCAMPA